MKGALSNVLRASLYVIPVALSPVAMVVAECAKFDYAPTKIAVASALLGGIVQGAISLRAYLDGSNERYRQERAEEAKP